MSLLPRKLETAWDRAPGVSMCLETNSDCAYPGAGHLGDTTYSGKDGTGELPRTLVAATHY